MLSTIIIDNQQNCIDDLSFLLKTNCTAVSIVALAHSGAEGITILKKYKPQLVFLDVEMQDMTGFEMLQQLSETNFHVVFTTAFDKYAIKAIRFNAIDYLLKPVSKNELIEGRINSIIIGRIEVLKNAYIAYNSLKINRLNEFRRENGIRI